MTFKTLNRLCWIYSLLPIHPSTFNFTWTLLQPPVTYPQTCLVTRAEIVKHALPRHAENSTVHIQKSLENRTRSWKKTEMGKRMRNGQDRSTGTLNGMSWRGKIYENGGREADACGWDTAKKKNMQHVAKTGTEHTEKQKKRMENRKNWKSMGLTDGVKRDRERAEKGHWETRGITINRI